MSLNSFTLDVPFRRKRGVSIVIHNFRAVAILGYLRLTILSRRGKYLMSRKSG